VADLQLRWLWLTRAVKRAWLLAIYSTAVDAL